MHKSTFAYDFTHGNPRQYFSLSSSWHYNESMQNIISQLAVLQKLCSETDLSPTEEIAFMVDDKSYAWVDEKAAHIKDLIPGSLKAVGRCGAPVGTWILSDIDKLPDRIKLIIIASAPAAASLDIKKLRSVIEKGKKTIVLTGAIGLVDIEKMKWDVNRTSDITGLKIDYINDMPQNNGERELSGGGKLIYRNLPILDENEYRTIAGNAGVHLYAPAKCYLNASKGAISVTSGVTGKIILNFPQCTENVTMRDLYTDLILTSESSQCDFELGQTRLFIINKNC
jgi:hypothetical protein